MKTLSIVTTLYRSAPYIQDFHRRIMAVAETHFDKNAIELILVNDGSPDNALDVAIELSEHDARVHVIELSRNFGHHKAIMTGLAAATGDYVFLIDIDLEEEPELLERCLHAMDDKTDVVFGVMEQRKGGWFERLSGDLFYATFNKLSDAPIPRNISTMRLMRAGFVKALLEFKETDFIIACIWQLAGFKQKPLLFTKKSTSQTSYSLKKKFQIAFGILTSFSAKPLVYISYAGMMVTALSALFIIYLIFKTLFLGGALAGWSSLIASILFMGGLNLFALGIIGLYISRIFTESKKRPFTLIRARYKNGKEIQS